MASPPGTKGDLKVANVLAGAGCAIGHRAAAKRAGAAEDATGAELGLGWVQRLVHKIDFVPKIIYRFFLNMTINCYNENGWNRCLDAVVLY